MKLKHLEEQVVVITGASSGIGLVTARLAADRGARLVLTARNEDALRQLTEEINGKGGDAIFVVADVGNEDEVRAVAQAAIDRFVVETNSDPKPFVWTADPKRVLAAVKRGKQALESVH